MDYCGFGINSTLQGYIFIFSKFTSGKLGYLLSLERPLESKLALVSACSFFVRDGLFNFL
jgi:hypothetical protein